MSENRGMAPSSTISPAERSIRQHASIGLLALVCLLGGVGGWSAMASIQGAVIAAGVVVVETSKKRVQHAEGGIVKTIHVKDDDQVGAGDNLFELDDTQIRAELDIIEARLFEAEAKQRRLLAGQEGLSAFTVPATLRRQVEKRPEWRGVVEVQQELLRTRRLMRENQEAQHLEQIARLEAEVSGYREQEAGRRAEYLLIKGEIKAIETLTDKGLALRQGLNNLRRQEADIRAERGRLATDRARAEGEIKELRVRLAEIGTRFDHDRLTALEETSASILDLNAQKVEAKDRQTRLVVRAPRGGFVHELAVHTVGAVIAPGETLLHIVPITDALVIEAKVRTVDIDQLHLGQEAQIRFPAFNNRTTPTLTAIVRSISADQSLNEQTGETYYTTRLILDEGETDRFDQGDTILAGMPAEVLITSEERTVLSYLIKPLNDQIARAFREE